MDHPSTEFLNKVKGIVSFYEKGDNFDLAVVNRECPYCWTTVEQPVDHVYVTCLSLWGTYICTSCGTYYYFVGDNIYQYIPEAQLMHIPHYAKRPSRLDTLKDYKSLFYRAKAFNWFEDIRLEEIDIVDSVWTMPVEVAAQMTAKDKTGKAPGYSIGYELSGNTEKYSLDGEIFSKALEILREKELF